MSFTTHLKEMFLWNKYTYLLSFALSSLAGIFCFVQNDLINLVGYGLLIFATASSFVAFQKDNFSIKYLQSLPLSKKELYHLKLMESFLSTLPLLYLGIVFNEIVVEILTDQKTLSPSGYFRLFSFYLLFAFLISLWSFMRLYEVNRAPYVKGSSKTITYILLRNWFYYIAIALYSLYGILAFIWFLDGVAPKFTLELIDFLSNFKSTWTLLALVAVFTIFEYQRIFRRWFEEKRSYVKNNWKPLRDIPLMGITLGLILLPPTFLFEQSRGSEFASASSVMDAVVMGRIEEVERLLNNGEDINRKTKYGYTPLMVAAQLGNEKMYFYLLSKAASKEGAVSRKENRHTGMDLAWLAIDGGNLKIVKDVVDAKKAKNPLRGGYPLHLAVTRCHEEVIDYLLSLGADPNVKNASQKTPLHKASQRGCLNGVISLIEAGAGASEKDERGKLALDYVNQNRVLRYYLEKKSRSPAGK